MVEDELEQELSELFVRKPEPGLGEHRFHDVEMRL